ncbi:MAG TPA: rhodanese-like domain-containing protein [Thioalkalivibrio sp.]|nr:rhodanese-like domain-containing protein [Thioalkalivibrio sp.]
MSMTAMDLVAEARQVIKEVDIDGAKGLMANNAIVLDVREPAEAAQGHLAGAVNIPRGVLEFKVNEHPATQDRDATYVVYCRTGGRSALACQNLQRMGFANVHSLAGGFEGWVGAGQAVEKDPAICG